MSIDVGDTLPDAKVLRLGADGRPEEVSMADFFKGKKVVIFGLPGAYTGTCTSAHVPSFIAAMDDLKAKGIEDVICVAVNDPFVMDAWAKSTGAAEAGITMLADAGAEFTKAVGLAFTAPPVGFYDRSQRYALAAEDGKVTVFHPEEGPGVCDRSGGATMVASL